jgi:hypothetical protein
MDRADTDPGRDSNLAVLMDVELPGSIRFRETAMLVQEGVCPG